MLKYIIFSLYLFKFLLVFSQDNPDELLRKDSNLTIFDLHFIDNKIDKQEDIIKQLNKNIINTQHKIYKTTNKLTNIKINLKIYKKIYSNILLSIYILKSNVNSTFIFLFSSRSFSQANLRYNYYKLLIYYLEKITQYIKLLQEEYTVSIQSMQKYKTSLEMYLANYQNEKLLLDSNVNFLLKQSRNLQQKSLKIRNTINSTYKGYELIEEAIISTTKKVKDAKFLTDSLIYPLNTPVLISSFGIHDHPYLKNVKIKNDGVDLFSKNDSLVKNVYNGIVASIIDVPNYGKSVIIKHNTNYYTVYSNLYKVYVNKNDYLFKKQIIGTISKKTSKYSFPCLNFQIWKNTKKINPANIYEF